MKGIGYDQRVPHAKVNGRTTAIVGNATVLALLQQMEIYPGRAIVECNGARIEWADFATFKVMDGDELQIVCSADATPVLSSS